MNGGSIQQGTTNIINNIQITNVQSVENAENNVVLTIDLIDGMKVSELKAMCKQRGQLQTGNKKELQDRLKELVSPSKKAKARKPAKVSAKKKKKVSAPVEAKKKKEILTAEMLDNMTVNELKVKCKSYGLKQTGNKKALQDRLKETAYFKKARAKKKKKDKDGDITMDENDMQSPFVIPFPSKKEAKKKKAAKTAKAVIKAKRKS